MEYIRINGNSIIIQTTHSNNYLCHILDLTLFCQRVISTMTCHCILRQNGEINCHKIFKGVVVTPYHIQNDAFRISSSLRI